MWVTSINGDCEDWEISICKKDNSFVQENWGWEGEDKIIIHTTEMYDGDPNYDEQVREVFNFFKKRANNICDAMNHHGVE